MLAPSGEGLIIYQAYGNLYAMTALGWHLEKIHVTCAHLEKKQTRLRTYTKIMKIILTESGDGVTSIKRRNNTCVLAYVPPGCKPKGCKWIFKRKMKMDETIEKFKTRLVIQGLREKLGINYFDTYAPQMDVKTIFLNDELDVGVYMNQPHGCIMPENENKVHLTKKFVSSKFSTKDMGDDDVILGIKIEHESNGISTS
uniref:Zinc finger, CCHC-type n=1 Tax=Tanacetum cinerariifolium TaxID=118510 RepID=A0A699I4Y4_TANCI|nr:zinc finger, CCHC-type [Tanacetum cinerariifolium]